MSLTGPVFQLFWK